MHEFKILEDYAGAIVFSLAVCSLLYNLFLISKIRYGQIPTNKLTIVPYYLSAVYFSVLFVHEIVYQLAYKDQLDEGGTLVKFSMKYMPIIGATYTLRDFLLVIWLIERVFSDHILYSFVNHQSELRLDELEVTKEEYMNREKKIQLFYRAFAIIVALTQTGIILLVGIFHNKKDKDVFLPPSIGILWFTVNASVLMGLLIAYMYLNICLLLVQHRRHRLEFKEHI